MSEPPAFKGPCARALRVFVSSTFRDMQQEREELVKRIFPQLRKRCEERGVVWGEVDLRWGITEEQRAEGEVLPVCLAEIERTRPYFLGIIGERYGWVPEQIPDELVEKEPWLGEHPDHSVTELEILHGVLRNPEMAEHAYFYLRDPLYLTTLPEELQIDYRDTGENVTKLQALKERIRGSGFPVREDYPNPKTLGELVLSDLTALIDRLFPEGSAPSPLDREAAEHEAFAASRTGVYIGRRECFEALDAHADDRGWPLVVTGESGAGKSALLANWADHYRGEHPEDVLLMHFVGASPASTDWQNTVRRLMGELNRRFDISEHIPENVDELRSAFAGWLNMAAARGKLVLVIDALDQLEDREGAPDLLWLPSRIPPQVRLVLSTLPGRALDQLQKREWPTLTVSPLEPAEREQLVIEYLGQYSKMLSPARRGRMVSAPQTANPLYLRALLEELRLWGDNETLDASIEHYLQAGTVDALYRLILARLENDYEDDRPGLVRDVLSALWSARRGLSEAELLEVLGSADGPLPQALWAPLYLAIESSLVQRSGLIGFFHHYLREAVRERYLPCEDDRARAHLSLAGYFERRRDSARALDELPWQLAQAGAHERLKDLLADLPFFRRAWHVDESEVRSRWADVERDSSLRVIDAYEGVCQKPERYEPGDVDGVARLLERMGHPAEALPLREYLVGHFRSTGDLAELKVSLGNLGVNCRTRGELDQALTLHQEGERISRQLQDLPGLQYSLGNQAVILQRQGSLTRALALHEEEARICRQLGDRRGLCACLGNQAVILQGQGLRYQALALYREEERICRELDDLDELRLSLSRQATIHYERGEFDEALALHQEEQRICHELGNQDGLQLSLGNQGTIFLARGDLESALALLRQQEQICRELGHREGLQYSLGNQAVALQARGEFDEALALFEEQERICRELDLPRGLQASLGNQGTICYARAELDKALTFFEEQERICRDLGDPRGVATALGRQGTVHCARGDLAAAMALQTEEEELWRQLGDPAGIALSLANQGILLVNMGRRAEGLELVEQACSIALSNSLTHLAQQLTSARAQLQGT